MISNELRKFLSEWLAWAEADAPSHQVFDSRFGLCRNVEHYSIYTNAYDELRELLGRDAYPFGGEVIYWGERKAISHHRNQFRLAWVRKTLEAAGYQSLNRTRPIGG